MTEELPNSLEQSASPPPLADTCATGPDPRASQVLLARDQLGPQAMRRGNHPWLVAGALVLGFVGLLSGLYGAIGRDLVWQWWDDPDYSHGFLVPLLSGFLVWKRRKQLAALKPNGTWIGAAVLVIALAELLLGDLAGENFLMRSSIVLVLAGLVLFHRGWPTFRLLAFPLLFLLFMVPLPATVFYAVAFPLQRLAAQNAAWVLDLMGVPVLLDGNVIHLSQISLGVTEACSGIRSLISLLAVAVAWGALTLPRLWAIGVLVAATVPITIVANAGRVVATGLIAQWVGTDYAQGFFHVVSGWVIFLLAFVCLLAVHGVLGLIQARRDKQGR